MIRIGRVLMFIAASVVSGLALAFLIVAWRPQLVAVAPSVPAGAALPGPDRDAAPQPYQPRGPGTVEKSNSAPGLAADGTARPGVTLAPEAEHLAVLFPGHDAWSYADAVQRAGPAVVNIYTTRTVTERVQPSGLGAFFGDPAPRFRSRTERSLGSGVIVDAEGHIATNNHVIENADQVRVQLADRRVAVAQVVGRDPDSDLALLKVDLNHLPVMPFGHSDQLQVGDVVLAIGNPLGLSQTVTHGIVSATGRGQLGLATFENFIQTDAAINPGNSGGALINTRGELVGINTAIVAKTLGVEGIGFAIPVNMVRGVIHDLISKGKVVRGWIGIIPEDIADDQAVQHGLPRGSVLLVDLYLNSPALEAGLQPGDVITAFDGADVKSSQDILAHIASTQPGATVKVTGMRDRSTFKATITVRQRPRDL
jgi:Do/DeqQ family serine protease